VRYGLLNEILPRQGYLLGRSVLNMSVGITQICGFAVGGVLIATLSARGALLAGAGAYLAAAAIARFGLSHRPPRAAGRPSIRQTWRNNAQLWSYAPRRYVYLALWVPNGLIVGCESLFVPYTSRHAGLLFASAALGMLAGDTLAGRFIPPRRRERLSAHCACCSPLPTWPSPCTRSCRWRWPPSHGLRPGRAAAPPGEPRDLPARDGPERARSAAAQ
jgi:hypothetical protein